MRPTRQVLLFRGSRAHEELLLNGKSEKIHPAQIICSILDLDESFFHRLTCTYEVLKGIEVEYQKQTESEKKDSGRKCLEKVRSAVWALYHQADHDEERLLSKLFVYFPCYDAYTHSNASVERHRVKQPYLTKVMQSDINDPVKEENGEFDKVLNAIGTLSSSWSIFIRYLRNQDEIALLYDDSYFNMVADVIFGCLDVSGRSDDASDGSLNVSDRSYADRFKLCIQELKRIKIDLHLIYEQADKDVLYELQNGLPGPRYYTYDEYSLPASETKIGKYNRVFELSSFSELIVAELSLLDTIQRSPRKCALCGRFFVPYRLSTKYCSYPNPAYNGKLCSAVAHMTKYRQNHAGFLNSPAGKQYERNYKSYSKWVSKNISYVNECTKSYGLLSKNYSSGDLKTLNHEVTAELEANIKKWREETHAVIKAYENGAITEEELNEKTALPDFAARSPRLKNFRKMVKEYEKAERHIT